MDATEWTATTTLGRLLENPKDFPWDAVVFLPSNGPWTADTACMVIRDANTLYGDDEHPAAVARGFREVLDVADIASIVKNATQQILKPTTLQLMDAFTYYLERDAFIDFQAELQRG